MNSNRIDKYKCEICLKIFQDSSGLRKHKLSKNACVSHELQNNFKNILEKEKENTKKLLEEKEMETNKLLKETEKLLEENMRKENEIIRLRNLMENNFLKDVQEIKEINKEIIKTNLEINKNITETNLEIKEKISEIESNGNPINYNNNYNLTQNNDNKKLNFNIQLSAKEKERLDHITSEQMLCILDQEDFSNSIADLVQAISFNPRAPENMTWCIGDKSSELGAIEYNSETKMLMRDTPTNVISKNLQNILFPVTDIFKELELNTTFNPQQNKNSDKYFDMLGQESYKKEYINSIKNVAYEKRGLCKALWDHLGIGLEVVKKRKNIKQIK